MRLGVDDGREPPVLRKVRERPRRVGRRRLRRARRVDVVVYVRTGGATHPPRPRLCIAEVVTVALPVASAETLVVCHAARFSCESAQKDGVGVGMAVEMFTRGVLADMEGTGVSVTTLVILRVPDEMTSVEKTTTRGELATTTVRRSSRTRRRQFWSSSSRWT